MGIHLGRKGAKPAPTKTGFSSIAGHRSLVHVAAIQKSNEAARKERLLKAVGEGVNALGDVVREGHAKKTAAKILSKE
jgi:hypothetical protein